MNSSKKIITNDYINNKIINDLRDTIQNYDIFSFEAEMNQNIWMIEDIIYNKVQCRFEEVITNDTLQNIQELLMYVKSDEFAQKTNQAIEYGISTEFAPIFMGSTTKEQFIQRGIEITSHLQTILFELHSILQKAIGDFT